MKDDRFEWDDDKAKSNIRKHDGVTFRRACAVFSDPFAIEVVDEREAYLDLNGDPEERINIVGFDADRRLLVVTYTWRGHRRRIITARRVNDDEAEAQDYYECRRRF